MCGSCLIRVTSMHYTKSIRIFVDDVTSPEHALVIQGGSLWCLGWWVDVCNLKNVLPSLGYHSILIRVLPSAFFSCALTVNLTDLLFLRQCFIRLTTSTETSVSGTLRQLPICLEVSQYV